MSEMPLPERGDRAVCRRCGMVMDDVEPFSPGGEFFHKDRHRDGTRSKCPNARNVFSFDRVYDKEKHRWLPLAKGKPHPEIQQFMRKRDRRAVSRATGRKPERTTFG